jgi:pimeloyl-ACP methyl ester carboxylesterase
LRKIVRENISHQLAQIELPSLVLWGKQDYTTPLEKGELFAELMPNAELVVFEQSGHYPFIDETELFMSVLEKYIQQQTKH